MRKLFCFILIALTFSCIKDVDLNQADDIQLAPVVETNLVFFTLDGSDFFDSETQSERLVVTDTTEIRFLDDTFMQEGLERAEMLFQFTNTISRNFIADFSFYSTEGELHYSIVFPVNAGFELNPQVTYHEEIIEGTAIEALTQTSILVVTMSIESSEENLPGELKLQSTATFYITF
jgi:hypothetical protein